MILTFAILAIEFEAITEALIRRFCPKLSEIIFKWWIQDLIAVALFGAWFIYAVNFDAYYVPIWKIITGFVFVRFGIFDITYNLVNGQKWNYYGTKKWYDQVMQKLGGFGWFLKIICLIMGIVFLMGWN